MIPDFKIAANGQYISALLRDRLLSLTVTDEAGYQSDALEIRLDNRNSRIALPAKGAALTVALGYRDTGLLPAGSYTVDKMQLQGPLQTLTIPAHAANMIATLKEPRERSWDDISLSKPRDHHLRRTRTDGQSRTPNWPSGCLSTSTRLNPTCIC